MKKMILITTSIIMTTFSANAMTEAEWIDMVFGSPPIQTQTQIGERYVENIVTESQPYTAYVNKDCSYQQSIPAAFKCSEKDNKFADFSDSCPFVAAHNITITSTCLMPETQYRDVQVDRSYMEPIYETKLSCPPGRVLMRIPDFGTYGCKVPQVISTTPDRGPSR